MPGLLKWLGQIIARALGLPSGYTTIIVYGFRGSSELYEELYRADLRYKYGHVGISLDYGKTIYGFNPWIEDGTPEEQAKRDLRNGVSFPGKVEDDTLIFDEVRGKRKEVREHRYHLDEKSFRELEEQLLYDREHSPLEHKRYSFPSGFAGGSYNCATYLVTLHIENPYPSGILKDYFPD